MVMKNKKEISNTTPSALSKTFIVFMGLILSLIMLAPNPAQAVIPFGGKVNSSTYCTCSFNFLLEIGPPVPATVMFSWFTTRQYPYYSLPRTGVWALGLYYPGGVCMMIAYPKCTRYGNPEGTINFVGTSR